MIDFLVNLTFNLQPKSHQNSTQEAPKTDKNKHRKDDASWLGIWNPLGADSLTLRVVAIDPYLGTSKLIYLSSDNLKIDITLKENL